MTQAGKYIFITGLLIMIAGGIMWLFGNRLTWPGNLPGDIKIERENVRFYFPVTTMILLSAALSFILWLVKKFLN